MAEKKKKTLQELLDEEEEKQKPKPKKKRNGWIWWLALVVVGLVVVWIIFKPDNTMLAIISMTSHVDNSSVVGPVSSLSFSSTEKIKTSELTTFSIKNSENVEFVGRVSVAKGKVKAFSWTPTVPLGAGTYDIRIDGDNVCWASFTFKVFEVEKVLPKETTPTTPKPAAPAESEFLKQLDRNMGNG